MPLMASIYEEKNVPFQKNLLKMSIVSWFICLDGSIRTKKKRCVRSEFDEYEHSKGYSEQHQHKKKRQPASKQTKEVEK